VLALYSTLNQISTPFIDHNKAYTSKIQNLDFIAKDLCYFELYLRLWHCNKVMVRLDHKNNEK